MAPSRGKGKTRASGAQSAPKKSTRSIRKTRNGAPDVYEELLAEEAKRSPETDVPERPLKRRRVAAGVHIPRANSAERLSSVEPASSPAPSAFGSMTKPQARRKPVQTIEASSDDDSGEDSDFAFEDVDLTHPTAGPAPAPEADDGIADVSISVDPSTAAKQRPPPVRRKPASNAEKALKLLTHKAHVLCLLGHCMYVNTWCNDITVQQHLHPLLSKKALTYLQGKEEYSQFQRDRSFRDGLEQASEIFRAHFTVNASGMRRAIWGVDGEEAEPDRDIDPTSRHDLIMAAREMEGSQDVGNQLFCALLRSAGVDARLVFSMQPLPLTNAQPKQSTPQKPTKAVVRVMPPYADPTTIDSNTDDTTVKSSSTIGKVPSARRRLGQPGFSAERVAATTSVVPAPRRKPVRKLDYPVFWVEAFNTAHQKWTPVDPLVTNTIGKPSKFEPPSSYAQNHMCYVMAFEEDGVIRDVTRRYTKAYNAKTRRNRVESTENGTAWFKKALRLFRRRGGMLDRDQTEDAELNQKEVREGLPGNVQDFKDHPVYALQRHLKRHEIIEPKREVGKVNAGTAAKPRMEPVYRRSDVLVCRSADKWYRLGREIQQGQAPIKHVTARNPRRGRSLSPDAEADEATGVGTTALYAQHQTEVYVAPPVVQGKVPRNVFGNLDLYVPSMVPPGGTHIRHALTQQAARILRVDYADAVTGFQFKGRHGTAIIQGAIVPTQHAEAVEAVIDGLLNERLEEESLARSAVALKLWKRFLVGLRIKERVSAYGTEGEADDVREEIDRQVDEQEEIEGAGGFFAEEPAMPTAGKFSLVEMARAGKQKAPKKGKKREVESESEDEAEFTGAESAAEEVEVPARRSKRVKRTVVHDEDEEGEEDGGIAGPVASVDDHVMEDSGGGFLPEDNDAGFEGGGGFVHENGEDVPNESVGGFVPEGDNLVYEVGDGGFLIQDNNGIPGDGGTANEDDRGGFLADHEGHVDESTGPIPETTDDKSPMVLPTHLEELAVAPTPEHSASDQNEASHALETENDHVVDQEGRPHTNAEAAEESLSMHGALQDDESQQREKALAEEEVDEPAATSVNFLQSAVGPPAENESQDGQDSDHGSMISHDPEDDDLEPDWLESD